jgi:putative transposase
LSLAGTTGEAPGEDTIDQSGANTATMKRYNRTHKTNIALRQCKDLNNIVEQDHRAAKRLTRPMLGFKSFSAARGTLAGIEVMHAIRTGQLLTTENARQTPAEQFSTLAA